MVPELSSQAEMPLPARHSFWAVESRRALRDGERCGDPNVNDNDVVVGAIVVLARIKIPVQKSVFRRKKYY